MIVMTEAVVFGMVRYLCLNLQVKRNHSTCHICFPH